jgi:predicted RecA/RadA family phage recombinase
VISADGGDSVKNYIKEGDIVTRTAPEGGLVSGQPFILEHEFLVAAADAAAGVDVSCVRRGVVDLAAKADDEFVQGGPAYFNSESAEIEAEDSDDNFLVGTVDGPQSAGNIVRVNLQGVYVGAAGGDLDLKADKVVPHVVHNFAGLTAGGNLEDSGIAPDDFSEAQAACEAAQAAAEAAQAGAETAQGLAETAQGAAEAAQVAAETAQGLAETAQAAAAASEANAGTSETNAAASASAASTSETNAATSESNAEATITFAVKNMGGTTIDAGCVLKLNPLSDGGARAADLSNWILDNSADVDLYGDLIDAGGGNWTVDLYSDPEKLTKVSTGTGAAGGTVALTSAGPAGFAGKVDVVGVPTAGVFTVHRPNGTSPIEVIKAEVGDTDWFAVATTSMATGVTGRAIRFGRWDFIGGLDATVIAQIGEDVAIGDEMTLVASGVDGECEVGGAGPRIGIALSGCVGGVVAKNVKCLVGG